MASQIDDYSSQRLRMTVFSDDLGWNDSKIAQGELTFGELVGEVEDPATGQMVDDFQLAEFIKVGCMGA